MQPATPPVSRKVGDVFLVELRVLKVKLQLADRGIAKEIYRFVFRQPESNIAEVSQQEDCDRKVERQVEAFAAKVPESKFSPAEIMSYVLSHWHSPAAAMEDCVQWVEGLLQEKKDKTKDSRKDQSD